MLKTNFKNYVKGEAMRKPLVEFLGNGIFVSDGPIWKMHRKASSSTSLPVCSTWVVATGWAH